MYISEEEFLKKYDNGDRISERDLLYYASTGSELDRDVHHRWADSVSTLVEINGRYFIIDWWEGKTEYQDNSCDEQPQEVKKIEEDIVIPEHIQHTVRYEVI